MDGRALGRLLPQLTCICAWGSFIHFTLLDSVMSCRCFLGFLFENPVFPLQISMYWHGGIIEKQKGVQRERTPTSLCCPQPQPGILAGRRLEAWNHPIRTQVRIWGLQPHSPAQSLNCLSPPAAILKGTGHFCWECWQSCSQLCFLYTNYVALLQYCFPCLILISGFSKLTVLAGATCFSQSTMVRPSLLTAGSHSHLSVHTLLLLFVLSTVELPYLAPGSALQASMKCIYLNKKENF